jgi:hypothetical protein
MDKSVWVTRDDKERWGPGINDLKLRLLKKYPHFIFDQSKEQQVKKFRTTEGG